MASVNMNPHADHREIVYDPVMQFFLRMIRTALDEACAVDGRPCPYFTEWALDTDAGFGLWDRAIMARDWIARETPDRIADECGYILSFEHCCEVLGLNADHEATWMLRKIDDAGYFDTDEVHARIARLTENPPDEVKDQLFESVRIVPVLDQGSLFGVMGIAA